MKLSTLSAIFLLCFTTAVFGQEEVVKFSIGEAVDFALEHNKTLKNAKDDIRLAEEQIKDARGTGLPQVESQVDYMTNFNYEFEFSMGGEAEPMDINYEVLDPGDFEVLDVIGEMFGSGGSTIVMEDQASANITVSQLIFSGQYWVGLEMARLGKSISEISFESTELDVKEQVMNSCYLILSTRALLEVIENNIANITDIYHHTNNMYRVGIAEQTDVDQIKINLSQLENSKTEMERSIQLSQNMFKLVLGYETDKDIMLTENLEQIILNLETGTLNAEGLNLSENPVYQLMNTQEEMGNKQVDLQKWAYAPTLVGFYSYKEKLLTTSFDLSPKNAAGLTLTVPIYSGGSRQAQLSRKKIELDQIKRNKRLLEEQLSLQDKQLSFDLKSAWDNYITQKENVEVASRVYQSYENKYKQGLVSSLELTQANSNYLQAESNFISAEMKLLQSKLALDKLYNKL